MAQNQAMFFAANLTLLVQRRIVVLFYVLFVLYRFMYWLCLYVYNCHRVTTQLQLTNISYQEETENCESVPKTVDNMDGKKMKK